MMHRHARALVDQLAAVPPGEVVQLNYHTNVTGLKIIAEAALGHAPPALCLTASHHRVLG